MTARRPTLQRKRSILGWFFLAVFVAFNLWAAYSVLESWAGAEVGQNTIGIGRVLEIWAWGAAILAVPVLLTRGRKVEVQRPR